MEKENGNNKLKWFNLKNESKAPQYTEVFSRGGWVNYGDDNLYSDYLISLMNRSGKHNGIIKRKSSMISGNGWNKEGLDVIALDFLKNRFNENLDNIVFKCGYDLEVFGAFSLEIIYSVDMSKIAEINYIPVNKVRLGIDGDYVYISNDWASLRKFAPVKIPVYNPRNPVSKQILYVKEYRPGIEYYGVPEYISGVNWIELEYEISLWHLSQVKNGFTPNMIVNFVNGVPSDDEMDEVIKRLREDFQGARKAGETMFLFSDGEENAVKITSFDLNDSDERFIELNKEITQGILTAHSVTNPGLFGISTAGEIGQKNVILESLEIFQSLYIENKQNLVEEAFNRLLDFNGSETPIKLNKYILNIEKITE